MIGYVSSLICAVITFGMALLQLSITFGAPFGEYVLGGQNKVLPKKMRFTSGTFFCIFTFIGMAYLQRGDILHMGFNSMFMKIVIIVNTLFLAYAIVGNGILTKSKKEKYVMTPFSIIQFILSVTVLLFT
ncbi:MULTISPECIES: hypothetical protein [unclassified Clostridium]|uniref:hypothetical protein n=1 Tax=unclassified Clostridium TaxID=2614128 RepID=UPI0002978A1B|nr:MULTISPECIES: hypothetical protein [unclassified Clostridium]EKQ56115.1 MAG: hypothetical protein A370_02337 [Clostridium sp. Maddingley MBC34-26]